MTATRPSTAEVERLLRETVAATDFSTELELLPEAAPGRRPLPGWSLPLAAAAAVALISAGVFAQQQGLGGFEPASSPVGTQTPVPTRTTEPSAGPTRIPSTQVPTTAPTASRVPTQEPSNLATGTRVPTQEPSNRATASRVPTQEPSNLATATRVPTQEPSNLATATQVSSQEPTALP